MLTVTHVPELRHRFVFPAQEPSVLFATQACCNHWSSSLHVYFLYDFVFFLSTHFARTNGHRQIPDCSVCVCWRSGLGVIQGCKSCTAVLLPNVFEQGVSCTLLRLPSCHLRAFARFPACLRLSILFASFFSMG